MMEAGPVHVNRPFYRGVLKHVLQKQIQTLINQLFDETGDETCVLSASIVDKTVVQYGSDRAKSFVSDNPYLSSMYLEFLQKAAAKEESSNRRINNKRQHGTCNDLPEIELQAKQLKFQSGAVTADYSVVNQDMNLLNTSSQNNLESHLDRFDGNFDVSPKQSKEDTFNGHQPEYVFNALNPKYITQNDNSCCGVKPKDLGENEKCVITLQHPIKNEFSSALPQNSLIDDKLAPDSLGMKAYINEKQTEILKKIESRKEMVNLQKQTNEACTAVIAPVNQGTNIGKELKLDKTSKLAFTDGVNIESSVKEPNSDRSIERPFSEDVGVPLFKSDAGNRSQVEDFFSNIIIKTEPCDMDINVSEEMTSQSDEHCDSHKHNELVNDGRVVTKNGDRLAIYSTSDNKTNSGNHLDEDASGNKGNICDENSLGVETDSDSNIVEDDQEKLTRRFKPFDNSSITKLSDKSSDWKTKTQTRWAASILKEWMKESNMKCDGFEMWPAEQLNSLLEMFYCCVRTKKGTEYSIPSLTGIRAGLNRYLMDPPFCRTISLMKDKAFESSNLVIFGKIETLKKEQLDICEHKEPITKEDMEKLYESDVFATDHPRTLQQKVQFEVMLQFGRRGREGLRRLRKDSFKLEKDPCGRRYIALTLTDIDETFQGARMYEQKGDKHCPVTSFLKYVSKLHPDCDEFFQRPLNMHVKEKDRVWYIDKPVGVNTLSSLMPRLSCDAELSIRYTNHCIRATVSNMMNRAGVSNMTLLSLNGYKNMRSLCCYRKLTEKQISQMLSSTNMCGEQISGTNSANASHSFNSDEDEA